MNKLLGSLKSKTMYFGLALVVFGVLESNVGIFKNLLSPEWYGYITAVIGMTVALLRWVTTVPLAEK